MNEKIYNLKIILSLKKGELLGRQQAGVDTSKVKAEIAELEEKIRQL